MSLTPNPDGCPGSADPRRPLHLEAGLPRWEKRKGKAASSGGMSWEPPSPSSPPGPARPPRGGLPGTRSWASSALVLSERQRSGGSEPGGCSCSRRQVPWSRPRPPGVCVGCWGCACTLSHTCEAVSLPAHLGVSGSFQGAPLLHPSAEWALGAAQLRGKGLRLASDTLFSCLDLSVPTKGASHPLHTADGSRGPSAVPVAGGPLSRGAQGGLVGLGAGRQWGPCTSQAAGG